MYRKSTVAFYVFGLITILLALARGSPAIGASVLAVAGTMGDLRVSRKSTSKIGRKPKLLRRTSRRVGGQTVFLAFVLLDIGGFGFALAEPVWLAQWVTINLMALVVGLLTWGEERKAQRESATAMQRQAENVRAAEQRKLEERERQQQDEQTDRLRKAEQSLREAEERLRKAEEQREAERQQRAEQTERVRQAEQQLREAEQGRCLEEAEREALRQQRAEQTERLLQVEQLLREAEEALRQQEEKRRAKRQQQAEQAERLRKSEERREAERRRHHQETQRNRQEKRRQVATQFRGDWWSVLGVPPSASKDEIIRNFRLRIKQCHPDKVVGLAPEFLELAEEHTKALNEAYENAMRCRRCIPVH